MIHVHIDGSCLGNSRSRVTPGGWAAIYVDDLNDDGKTCEVDCYSQSIPDTTSDRAELTAFIEAMNIIAKKGDYNKKITIHTDSRYVVDGYTAWLSSWIANGWKRRNGKPVLNKDLWLQIAKLPKMTELSIEWEKGHAGNKYNEIADKLAHDRAKHALAGGDGCLGFQM